jgi:hypothetical protein
MLPFMLMSPRMTVMIGLERHPLLASAKASNQQSFFMDIGLLPRLPLKSEKRSQLLSASELLQMSTTSHKPQLPTILPTAPSPI